jgi:aminopeptidase N
VVTEVRTTWVLQSAAPLEIQLDTSLRVIRVRSDGNGEPGKGLDEVQYAIEGRGIYLPHQRQAGDTLRTLVRYHGSPREGLLFTADSIHGRSVFADNWPDRAHFWIPLQDHASAKATVDFHVEVPRGYKVVATGRFTGIDSLAYGRTAWNFHQAQPVPPYGMVFAAGRLALDSLSPAACEVKCVPQTLVTFPEDSSWAVTGPFRRISEIVDWMSRLVGPFPYDRLDQVEASTMFGGMENPTAIFYALGQYRSHRLGEGIVAHETAHQWFGDGVTEADWRHVWLSEGFATYFSALWEEHADGEAAFHQTMQRAAERVFESPVKDQPILAYLSDSLVKLLNPNSYEKGAWVLHSLRGLMGDSAFFGGIRRYYQTFRDSSALSSDFARIMSEAAGQDLDWYFRQALTQPGYPRLAVTWQRQGRKLTLRIRQVQPEAWGRYRLPGVTLQVDDRRITADVNGPETVVTMDNVRQDPRQVVVDPGGWWLMEQTVGR